MVWYSSFRSCVVFVGYGNKPRTSDAAFCKEQQQQQQNADDMLMMCAGVSAAWRACVTLPDWHEVLTHVEKRSFSTLLFYHNAVRTSILLLFEDT